MVPLLRLVVPEALLTLSVREKGTLILESLRASWSESIVTDFWSAAAEEGWEKKTTGAWWCPLRAAWWGMPRGGGGYE